LIYLTYRSPFHAILVHLLQPWLVLVLALGTVAGAVYVRQWRATQALRRQALADSARAAEVLDLVVPTSGDPMIGALLDGFRLTERLGQGGLARVYKAYPDGTLEEDQAVAIKVLDADMAQDENFVRRFNREKAVYLALNHPHIVQVLGFGNYHEHYYLVMELIRGSTLRDHIKPDGMEPARVLWLMRPVFQALHYAHTQGIVHRDLKPENIMVTIEGQVKLMDFGLAGGRDYSQVTATGSILGTPAYIAPEQVRGELDPQSDQYALGVTLFELLTGQPPFSSDNPVNIVFMHLSEEPPKLSDLRPELAKVAPVVARMLSKSPRDRYPTTQDALTAFEEVAG
jgi:serine/threonine-protein kinase